jgi:hypothetical protein
VGSVLQPGQSAVFQLPEIRWKWSAPDDPGRTRNTPKLTETATYKVVGSPVTYTANFNLEYTTGGRGPVIPDDQWSSFPLPQQLFLEGGSTCSSSGASCKSEAGRLYQFDSRREVDTVTLLDNPDTKVTVGADNRKFQEQLLGLCDGGGADCKFAVDKDGNTNQPVTPVQGYGFAHLPTGYNPVVNSTSEKLDTTITVSDATAQASTWSVSSTLKPKFPFLDKIVEAQISGNYGQTTTATHTFSQAIKVTAQPGETAYIFTATPILRYNGTWTVKLGNPDNNEGTTYTLTDTYIDRPNPAGNAVFIAKTFNTGSADALAAQNGKIPADFPGVPAPLAGTTQGAGRETRKV